MFSWEDKLARFSLKSGHKVNVTLTYISSLCVFWPPEHGVQCSPTLLLQAFWNWLHHVNMFALKIRFYIWPLGVFLMTHVDIKILHRLDIFALFKHFHVFKWNILSYLLIFGYPFISLCIDQYLSGFDAVVVVQGMISWPPRQNRSLLSYLHLYHCCKRYHEM